MDVFYQDYGMRTPLVQILVQLLQFHNDELRMTSARLLFDMHKRESILFSNAADSYISTEPSFPTFADLLTLGSLSDQDKLFVKMHTGQLGDLRQTLLDKLDEIASGCLLEDDPAEPHPSYQGITYSTRERPVLAIYLCWCKCVHMHVCVYVCMYICMYVCVYVRMDGRMDGWMDGCMHACVCLCMCICYNYVCVHRQM